MAYLPSLFVSHGAPTFARDPGTLGPRLTALGRALPRPAAVVVVSPHWTAAEPRVTASPAPATLHDFGGFDEALYEITYPAPGDPDLARRIVGILRAAGWGAEADPERGRDHGAWVPLLHLYPEADVPVVQVAMPARLDGGSAYALGRALAGLAADNALIVGSGSLTHNLREALGGGGNAGYVSEFTAWVREVVASGDHDRLRRTLEAAPHAARAHPTPDHFWPLLVAAGAAPSPEPVTVLEGGITYGVLAMTGYVFGQRLALDRPDETGTEPRHPGDKT